MSKSTEEALYESQASLAGIIDSAMDAIITVDEEQRVLVFNRAAERMFHCPFKEALGQSLDRFIPKRFRPSHSSHIQSFGKTGVTTRTLAVTRPVYGLRANGEEFPVEASISQVEAGGQRLYTVIMRDVTERMRAEEALRESEERYKDLIDSAFDGVVIMKERVISSANRSFAEIFGYTAEELIGMDVLQLTSEPELVRSQIATNEPRYETIGLKKDGTHINIEVSAKACLYEREPARLSAVRDITERKRAEEQLRRQLDFTEAITSSLGEGLYALDKNGRVKFMNPAAEIGLGWKQEELLGQSMHEVIHFQKADRTPRSSEDCPVLGVLKSGQMVKVESDVFTRKDGTIFPVSYTSSPIITEGQVIGAVLAFHDVTERIELEEQFRQSQKMEAVGQLAGGVAHDFNNLLTAINGYSALTLARLQAEDPLRRNLEEIRKAGDRAAALTRQLLAFSRKQVLQPKVFNLNSVVSDLERMLRRLIGEDKELRTVLESKLGSIKADPGQIEQIIMNLVVNARDALLQGGKLTIETKNVYLDNDYTKHHIAVVPGPFVMLAVSDTGIGMDEQTKARIFEPFFTTKLAGKGTGLGLSTVYGIVKQSGGNIWVYSEAGRGTTFKVYLPRVDEGAQEYKRNAETVEDLQGTGTILLAEDEEMVRTLARQVLEMYGYQVLEAANGGAALLICERHKEGIHLLVTDVVMPEMSGPELADRLAQLRPKMKVLFMSGYTDDTIVHQGVLDEGTPFIQKPFAPDDLARKVKEVLGRSKLTPPTRDL
jgi:PAS domain S-box-containing protein